MNEVVSGSPLSDVLKSVVEVKSHAMEMLQHCCNQRQTPKHATEEQLFARNLEAFIYTADRQYDLVPFKKMVLPRPLLPKLPECLFLLKSLRQTVRVLEKEYLHMNVHRRRVHGAMPCYTQIFGAMLDDEMTKMGVRADDEETDQDLEFKSE